MLAWHLLFILLATCLLVVLLVLMSFCTSVQSTALCACNVPGCPCAFHITCAAREALVSHVIFQSRENVSVHSLTIEWCCPSPLFGSVGGGGLVGMQSSHTRPFL